MHRNVSAVLERIDAPARHTEFLRASATPSEIITIHYDSRANLIARGIIRERPLPTPREPECNITQTWSRSSRQISMKWFPPPSVPSWFAISFLRTVLCFSTIAFHRGSRSLMRATRGRRRLMRFASRRRASVSVRVETNSIVAVAAMAPFCESSTDQCCVFLPPRINRASISKAPSAIAPQKLTVSAIGSCQRPVERTYSAGRGAYADVAPVEVVGACGAVPTAARLHVSNPGTAPLDIRCRPVGASPLALSFAQPSLSIAAGGRAAFDLTMAAGDGAPGTAVAEVVCIANVGPAGGWQQQSTTVTRTVLPADQGCNALPL